MILLRPASVLAFLALVPACHREDAQEPPPRASSASVATADPPGDAGAPATHASVAAPEPVDAAPPPPPEPRAIGPYVMPFVDKRDVFFAVPSSWKKPQRLIANLHGMCNPPGYACGYWTHASSEEGFLVCPTGNAECAKGVPTWTEGYQKADDDLETAIAAVDAKYPGEISRDGSILTGFSLGATMAALIAERHPGRWPYLILIESNVPLIASKLRAAGVRAVALVAGELGESRYGESNTATVLAKQGFPARFWMMPQAGHWYSANIDDLMKEAMEWLIAQGEGDGGAAPSAP